MITSVFQLLRAGLGLDASALAMLADDQNAAAGALGVLILAGLSCAVAHSVVLLINRTAYWRLVWRSLIFASLLTVGVLLWAVSGALVAGLLPGSSTPADMLLFAGFVVAPLTLSFLTIVPYVGLAIESVLEVWAALAMLAALMTAFDVDFLRSLLSVSPGVAVLVLWRKR